MFHKLTNNYLSFTLSVSILGLIGKQWIIFYESEIPQSVYFFVTWYHIRITFLQTSHTLVTLQKVSSDGKSLSSYHKIKQYLPCFKVFRYATSAFNATALIHKPIWIWIGTFLTIITNTNTSMPLQIQLFIVNQHFVVR